MSVLVLGDEVGVDRLRSPSSCGRGADYLGGQVGDAPGCPYSRHRGRSAGAGGELVGVHSRPQRGPAPAPEEGEPADGGPDLAE